MNKPVIWVLSIECKWGADITLWEDYEDANKHLQNYVFEHWDSYFVEEYGQWDETRANDLVDIFFNESMDDSYTLDYTVLNRSTA